MRILMAILMLFSASAFSGQVTVNGSSCGSWSKLTYTPAGDLALTTDGACGTVTPPADPPPVVTPPASCPAGVICVDRPFPVIPQEVMTLRAGQVLAVRVKVPASGAGYVSTMNSTGDTATRRVALSTVAGDLNPAQSRCGTQSFEVTSSAYTIGEGTARACYLPAGSVAFINIALTNCEAGKTCRFYLKAQ